MRHQHPAYGPPVCQVPDCGQPAVARVAYPLLPTPVTGPFGFAIVRPASSPVGHGDLMCADCAHLAVDRTLMAALPAPDPTREELP